AMIQYMFTEILEKIDLKEVLDIQNIVSDAKISYIIKVNLEVLIHLYNFFADYLLVLEKQSIPKN
ncbi:17153_t:CDS:1, partial [Cetraspora pellucida]